MIKSLDRKFLTALSHHQIQFAAATVAFMVIGFILPWWSIIFVGGLIGWHQPTLLRAAMLALMTCFTAWLLLTLGFDMVNGFRISTRIGGLAGAQIPIVANLAASVIGGLVAMLAAATGNQFRKLLELVRASR